MVMMGIKIVIFLFRGRELVFEHEKVCVGSLLQQLGGAVGDAREIDGDSDRKTTKLDGLVFILLGVRRRRS